jgi:hypothetical protein
MQIENLRAGLGLIERWNARSPRHATPLPFDQEIMNRREKQRQKSIASRLDQNRVKRDVCLNVCRQRLARVAQDPLRGYKVVRPLSMDSASAEHVHVKRARIAFGEMVCEAILN